MTDKTPEQRLAEAEGRLLAARGRGAKPDVIAKLEDAVTAARERARRDAAAGEWRVSMNRALDRITVGVAAKMKRWKDERAKEPKRIKDRKKELERRTTKDLRTGPSEHWHPGPPSLPHLPAPIAQPDFDEDEIGMTAPPRPGLMPGEYVEDADRAQRIVGQLLDRIEAPRLPDRWTPEHVASRLIEAHAVLRRLPMSIWPKKYGRMWPEYTHEAGELVHQAAEGTLEVGRNRVFLGTSADEIARMNEAFDWLLSHPTAAPYVNAWACDPNRGPDDEPPQALIGEFNEIARALNARNVVVR